MQHNCKNANVMQQSRGAVLRLTMGANVLSDAGAGRRPNNPNWGLLIEMMCAAASPSAVSSLAEAASLYTRRRGACLTLVRDTSSWGRILQIQAAASTVTRIRSDFIGRAAGACCSYEP